MKDTNAQRNYKDTMFRMLFSEKRNLLSLYNALNGTSYTDTDDYCIKNGILEEFLSKNRAEAIEVSIFEYNEEQHIRNEKEFSYREGHMSGLEQGIRQEKERITLLQKNLLQENRMEDLRRSIEDEEYREKLYTEYEM